MLQLLQVSNPVLCDRQNRALWFSVVVPRQLQCERQQEQKNCCVWHLEMLPCLNFCLPTPAMLLLFYIWLPWRSVTGTESLIEIQTVEWKELSLPIFPSFNRSISPRNKFTETNLTPPLDFHNSVQQMHYIVFFSFLGLRPAKRTVLCKGEEPVVFALLFSRHQFWAKFEPLNTLQKSPNFAHTSHILHTSAW